jgi:hypothetical protein
MRRIFTFLSIVFFLSCSSEKDFFNQEIISRDEKAVNFTDFITVFKDQEEKTSVDIGIWMFKTKELNLNSIANWIGVQNEGKFILEPINVVWVDYVSKSKQEAEEKVITFLINNNFLHRSGSSIGYAAVFEQNYWIEQYRETWSDKLNPNTINNHGRVFLGFETKTNEGNRAFVSTGAFSVEDEKHLFLSFDDALKQFNETEIWKIYSEYLSVNNVVKNYWFSTFDHRKIKTFILK